MAQINRLHEAGFTGKGIRVGIIDTGIDYTHPALGGCFGEGCLIAYGKDLVGKNYSWDDPPVEDDDPMDDDCPGSYGHGTHVAGIIAAQPNEHGFVGAAPGATLGFYKVCGGVPYLPDDLIVSAMNMAVEDGSDVLSISIGLISASPDNPAALMASRIVLDGTPVVSAASNAGGFSSYWSVTSPCVGSYVTCVGAVVPDKLPLFVLDGSFSVDNGPAQRYGRMRLMYNAPVDFPDNVTLPVWDASLETGLEEAACEPLPDDTPDLSDHLVIVGMGDPYRVRDSSCLPDVMVSNLADKGARHIMVYPRKVGSVLARPSFSPALPFFNTEE
jgi:subtilisin family serine protease